MWDISYGITITIIWAITVLIWFINCATTIEAEESKRNIASIISMTAMLIAESSAILMYYYPSDPDTEQCLCNTIKYWPVACAFYVISLYSLKLLLIENAGKLYHFRLKSQNVNNMPGKVYKFKFLKFLEYINLLFWIIMMFKWTDSNCYKINYGEYIGLIDYNSNGCYLWIDEISIYLSFVYMSFDISLYILFIHQFYYPMMEDLASSEQGYNYIKEKSNLVKKQFLSTSMAMFSCIMDGIIQIFVLTNNNNNNTQKNEDDLRILVFCIDGLIVTICNFCVNFTAKRLLQIYLDKIARNKADASENQYLMYNIFYQIKT